MFLLLFLQFFLKKQNFYSYQAFHILDFADYIPTVSVSILFCLLVLLFNCSVVSNSLQPHGLQHARLPCPSPGACSNSCPLSWWCHPTILCSVIPFSSHLKYFPASGSFQVSQFFTLGAQSTGVSALASVLPMNIQDWFLLGLTGWISLQSKGLSRVCSNTSSKASILQRSAFFIVQLSHPYMTTGKIIALTRWTFVGKVRSLLFNMLSRLVITLLPRSKHLLISWLHPNLFTFKWLIIALQNFVVFC